MYQQMRVEVTSRSRAIRTNVAAKGFFSRVSSQVSFENARVDGSVVAPMTCIWFFPFVASHVPGQEVGVRGRIIADLAKEFLG